MQSNIRTLILCLRNAVKTHANCICYRLAWILLILLRLWLRLRPRLIVREVEIKKKRIKRIIIKIIKIKASNSPK
jgi:hypothetical protein